jgi:enoyl-CoA hydratase/carnithine racemase
MTTPTPTSIPDLTSLHERRDGAIVTITIDNPPVNVLSAIVMHELHGVLARLAEDPTAKVIVFDSAAPEFFIAHVDMHIGEHMDVLGPLAAAAPEGVNVFQAVGEQIRRQPQVTIVKLAGVARGGGAEFVAAADMAFAAKGSARLGQVEALMGIVPAGGGTQYLAERMGRNRALELILTGDAVDADMVAAYGWINRAVADDELDEFVDRVARSIAGLADGVAAAVKRILPPASLTEGYQREEAEWGELIAQPAAGVLMGGSLARGAQTPEGERDIEGILRTIDALGD